MNKRKIDAVSFVQDVRAGLTDLQLMTKYRLTNKGLQSAFDKLLSAKLLTQTDLDFRPLEYDDTVSLIYTENGDFRTTDKK